MTEPRVDARLGRRVIWTLTFANLFLFLGAGAQQQFLVTYLGDLTDWSPEQRAGVIAALYFSMMVFRIANVWLLRRWPDRLQSIVGSLTYTGFCVVMALLPLRPSYALAFGAALVWGWGGAALWAGSSLQILAASERGSRRYGATIGLLYTSTHLGFTLGVILLGLVYQALDQASLYVLYVAAAGITILGNIVLLLTPRLDHVEPEAPSLRSLFGVLSRPKAQIAGFLQLAAALGFGLMLGSFGEMIKAPYGKQWIWLLAAPYPLARLIWAWASGAVSDRLGRAWSLGGSFGVVAVALAGCALWSNRATIGIAAAALGLLSTSVPVIASAMVGDSADRERRPLAYGSLFTFRDAGVVAATMAGPLLKSYLGNFQLVFLVFAALFAVCGVVSVALEKWAEQRL
jgi:MFS family permease